MSATRGHSFVESTTAIYAEGTGTLSSVFETVGYFQVAFWVANWLNVKGLDRPLM